MLALMEYILTLEIKDIITIYICMFIYMYIYVYTYIYIYICIYIGIASSIRMIGNVGPNGVYLNTDNLEIKDIITR
jgi:hypothetical protein